MWRPQHQFRTEALILKAPMAPRPQPIPEADQSSCLLSATSLLSILLLPQHLFPNSRCPITTTTCIPTISLTRPTHSLARASLINVRRTDWRRPEAAAALDPMH